MAYTDEDLLRLVGDERKRSIGFGQGDGGELAAIREMAIKYNRGEMDDVVAMTNRSKAVSTDLAEAVETVLPDLIEIFIGGDDVATFDAVDEADQPKAEEETAYVNRVVFNDNAGFLAFLTAFKDALLLRTGLFHWWWEEDETDDVMEGHPVEVYMQAQEKGQGLEEAEVEQNPDGTLSVTVKQVRGKVCIKAWPPEDFTVAQNTVDLKDATYCCARSRIRVQELIANGVDPELARGLPDYVPIEIVTKTRDEAGEHNWLTTGGIEDLRTVEVREHYIRLLDEASGDLQIHRVLTDSVEGQLIESEVVDAIPFAAITPYLNAHRFYGESVADKIMEVQRIKTALLRMTLDSGYFALNQRMEVAQSLSNEYTVADLLRNEPNVPVRVNAPGAIRPLAAGGLNFDTFAALEYASTMGEARSGIVRNAQGLNPDTLHDTAKGALALMGAAQRRVRMIARTFAETGVKDMFIGVRDMLRKGYQPDENGTRKAPIKSYLKGQWRDIDPSQWPERSGMTIQIGVGSAGKEHDLMVATQGLQIAQELVQMQGGADGPLVDQTNIHNWLKKWSQASGIKAPELFWSDPNTPRPPQPPKPDPEMAKAQAMMQLEQQKAQGQLQLSHAQAQSDAQLQAAKIQAQGQADEVQAQRAHELAMAKLDAEMGLKRWQTEQELALKREQLQAELQLKLQLGMAQAQVAHTVGMAKVDAGTSQVEVGGEPG